MLQKAEKEWDRIPQVKGRVSNKREWPWHQRQQRNQARPGKCTRIVTVDYMCGAHRVLEKAWRKAWERK